MRRRQVLAAGLSLAGLSLAGCDQPGRVPGARPSEASSALSPLGAAALFRPGSRHVLTTGDVAVAEVVPAGTVRLPSGRLMAADPSWLPVASWSPPMGPFTATVPPGTYPVDLALLRWQDLQVAAARLTVRDEPVVGWEFALLEGQDPATLPPDSYFGTGVDAGVIALFDARAADAVGRYDDDNPAVFNITQADRPVRVPNLAPGADAVAFSTGWGDGHYPTWVGRTRSGRVGCFIVDMLMVASDSTRWSPAPPSSNGVSQ